MLTSVGVTERIDSEWLRRLLDGHGLQHGVYHVRTLPGADHLDPVVITTYPQEWVTEYVQRGYVEVDPVISTSERSILPVDWRNLGVGDPRVTTLFDESRRAGIGPQGLTVPIRGPQGEVALFSATSDVEEKRWVEMLPDTTRLLQTIAFEVHHAVMTAALGPKFSRPPPLSRRERQVLMLAARGHPMKRIADTLAISEHAVKLYLELARHKLHARNTTHAVAFAISRSLIPPPE
jgi:DNA-binding CsgD family transcriptional regulator